MAQHTGFSPGDSMAGSSLNVTTSSGSINAPQPPLKTAKNDVAVAAPAVLVGSSQHQEYSTLGSYVQTSGPQTDVVTVTSDSRSRCESVNSSSSEVRRKRALLKAQRELAESKRQEAEARLAEAEFEDQLSSSHKSDTRSVTPASPVRLGPLDENSLFVDSSSQQDLVRYNVSRLNDSLVQDQYPAGNSGTGSQVVTPESPYFHTYGQPESRGPNVTNVTNVVYQQNNDVNVEVNAAIEQNVMQHAEHRHEQILIEQRATH